MNTQIKAEELRVGNLIEYNGAVVPVSRIDDLNTLPELGYKGSVSIPEYWNGKLLYHTGVWLANCKPVPITEDLLLKAGFVKEIDTILGRYVHPDGRHHVVPRGDGVWVYRVPGVSLVDIRYIHQLQNLFYWLSGGKELTL